MSSLDAWDDVPCLDLVNNAGVMAIDLKLTEDCVESQFATNRLRHFLFTNLIMEKILTASEPRIDDVSSAY